MSRKHVNVKISYELILLLLCIIAYIVFSFSSKGFLTSRNFFVILREMSIVSVMGMGVTFVLTIGEMDLTIGNLPALCGCIVAVMAANKYPTWIAIVISLTVAVGFGLLNGLVTHKIGLPSIVTTLATGMIIKGMAYVVADNTTVVISDTVFLNFFGKNIEGFPRVFIWMVALGVVSYIILKRMKLGRECAFVGENKKAAFYSGISIGFLIVVSFIICALFSFISGMMGAAEAGNANGYLLANDMMTAFSATFIGGTSMSGGRGNILGTIFGALFLCILENGLLIMGIATWVLYLINGIIIIVAIIGVGKIETFLEALSSEALEE